MEPKFPHVNSPCYTNNYNLLSNPPALELTTSLLLKEQENLRPS